MLKINSKSMDFSGSSSVDNVVIATMHASYNGSVEMYANLTVRDVVAYVANKAIVDADFAAFCAEVAEMAVAGGTVDKTPEEENME